MAQLDLPDTVFNWLVDYFRGHEHCTQFKGMTSAMLPITVNIVQGSAVGSRSGVVCCQCGQSDSCVVHQPTGQVMRTTPIILASNVETRAAELDHVEQWAAANNLRLNRRKSTEIIFVDSRRRRAVELPSPV